ncbi:MAG: glycosyltransferase family 4 protein [Pseudomonadota bacterium]
MKVDLYFAVPGDLNTLTGGYGYDRRLLVGLRALGMQVEHHALAASFPAPDAAALSAANHWLQSLPDNATVLIDGLAFGVMDAVAAQHAERLRLIALCHHPLSLETGLSADKQQQLHQSEQRVLQIARAIVVTSTMTRRTLIEQFSIAGEKITAAAPGTDRRGFAACQGQPPILLTVATLTQRKAHDVLITALSQLQHLPWRARFVGGGEFDAEWTRHLLQQVQTAGLQSRIDFVGALTELHNEYIAADIFVLPSLFEGYGMAFAEALAYGLPVIAGRAGAVPTVVPASAGLLVEPGSVEDLRGALHSLLTDTALQQRLQSGAREAATHLPTWEQAAITVKELIMKVSTR